MTNRPPLTADSIIDTASRLGLTLKPRTARYFDLEEMCACPAGVAAIMYDPHAAKASFGIGEAFRILGPEITSGLVFGFDLGWRPHPSCDGVYVEFVTIGAEIRARVGVQAKS